MEDPSEFVYTGLYDPRVNEANNLLITKDGLYKTYSDKAKEQISDFIDSRGETPLEQETILCTFEEGKTVFSLLIEEGRNRKVFHRKLESIIAEMFGEQANADGTKTEHPKVHRLIRILKLIIQPTEMLRGMTYDEKLTPRSILKMSIYLHPIFRDILMRIAAQSKENSLQLYIDNLADLKRLLKDSTPTLIEFL